MFKLLVIADDFTGALDTGVQFSKKGVSTLVTTEMIINRDDIKPDIEVLVVDIESRHVDKEEAAKRVETIAKQAKSCGIKYIYKKTDSTLRGNIGAELAALMTACNTDNLMFVPAFPKTGRATIKGYQYVNGIPLHETVFAKDPFEPVKHSYIPDIIRQQTEVNTAVINYKDKNSVRKTAGDSKTIYIFDAQLDDDLKEIGNLLKDEDRLKITAGCAGFAEFLPELLELRTAESSVFSWNINTLVVSGSVNQLSLNQIRYAQGHGYESVTLTSEQKLEKSYLDTIEGEKLVNEIVDIIQSKRDLIIKTIDNREQMGECTALAKRLNINQDKMHLKIAENMGILVKRILDRQDVNTLIVFGGDTVLGIMKALECYGIIPYKEIVPGVVISQVVNGKYDLHIITKAGGFGDEDVLIKIKEYLVKGE